MNMRRKKIRRDIRRGLNVNSPCDAWLCCNYIPLRLSKPFGSSMLRVGAADRTSERCSDDFWSLKRQLFPPQSPRNGVPGYIWASAHAWSTHQWKRQVRREGMLRKGIRYVKFFAFWEYLKNIYIHCIRYHIYNRNAELIFQYGAQYLIHWPINSSSWSSKFSACQFLVSNREGWSVPNLNRKVFTL